MSVKKTTKATPKTTKKAAPAKKNSTLAVKNEARTTKKAPPKPPVTVKNTSVRPVRHEEEAETISARESRTPSMRLKKSYIIAGLALLLLAGLLYAGRSLFIAATVNGQPISRLNVIQELERQSGKQTLDSLVTKQLILQEAKKQNIQVSEQQVNDEIKKIENNLKQQGQNLDQVLALQGLTRESLRDQVRVQKIVEILLGRQIVVSDKEVSDYIASNSAQLPQDLSEDQLKTNIKQQLRQQKLSEKFQTWLASIRQNAKVNYFVTY